MIYDKAEWSYQRAFWIFFFDRNQIGLEKSMKGRDFIFDCVNLLYCKCHKISFNSDGSNRYSSDWIKSKKATINPVNKDDRYF